jgi:hypothetical protein
MIARPASACGASSPPSYAVDELAPQGVGVPVNAPVQVTLRVEETESGFDASIGPSLVLTPTGSDLAVDLRPVGAAPGLTWVPLSSLEPQTSYTARFDSGNAGVAETSWEFTTGSAAREPLSLDGRLEISLEAGTMVVPECGPCGNDCVDGDEVAVVRARVKLPRARGGFAPRRAWLWLTDDRPYDFSEPSKGTPEPYRGTNVSLGTSVLLDDETETLVVVPEEDAAYRPCFALQASDARDDRAEAPSVCLDPFPAPDSPSSVGGEAGAGATGAPSTPAARASSSCRFGVSPTGGHGAVILVALALGAARSRQRRSRAKPNGNSPKPS